MAMLSKREFQKLIMQHGPATHYTTYEGGSWIQHMNPDGQFKPGLHSMQAMHSLRFKNEVEWDEINGIRPEDCRSFNLPQKDLRK